MTVDDAIQRLVRTIHDHPVRTVLVTAGAGSQALADLLAVGGASRTLVEGVIPYSQAAFDAQVAYWTQYFTDPAKNGGLSRGAVTDPAADIAMFLLGVETNWRPTDVPARDQWSEQDKKDLADLAELWLKSDAIPTARARRYLQEGIPESQSAKLKADELLLVGITDTLGRVYLPKITDAGPALSSMLIFLVMAVVLAVFPTGLYGRKS